MAVDTDEKRCASLNFGQMNKASVRIPTNTSTAFERGATLSLYYEVPGGGPDHRRSIGLFMVSSM